MAQLVKRQFDVVANPSPEGRHRAPYLVILQSHHLHSLATVIVAPLIRDDLILPDGATSIAVEFGDEGFTVAIGLMANIESRALGRPLGDLKAMDYEIQRAIDRIFTGF